MLIVVSVYNEHGFYVYNGYSYYDLRPEVLESNFYAWRATGASTFRSNTVLLLTGYLLIGDTKYLDRAKSAYTSFNTYLTAQAGYAPIDDVRNVTSEKIDNMESFWCVCPKV